MTIVALTKLRHLLIFFLFIIGRNSKMLRQLNILHIPIYYVVPHIKNLHPNTNSIGMILPNIKNISFYSFWDCVLLRVQTSYFLKLSFALYLLKIILKC